MVGRKATTADAAVLRRRPEDLTMGALRQE
jgi:hypothetical protein